jgi:hypothetical protein
MTEASTASSVMSEEKKVPQCKDCKWMVMLKKTEMCNFFINFEIAAMRRRSRYSCGPQGRDFEPKQVDA